MHAVVAGRVEDGFKPARHLVDGFGVDPELVEKVQARNEENDVRVIANQHQRNTEEDQAGERSEPGLTQGRGQIVVPGRMVR